MKTIKLLLTDTIDNLGIVGDVVTVKPGFARNYLIPRGLATDPTEGNIKRLAAWFIRAERLCVLGIKAGIPSIKKLSVLFVLVVVTLLISHYAEGFSDRLR